MAYPFNSPFTVKNLSMSQIKALHSTVRKHYILVIWAFWKWIGMGLYFAACIQCQGQGQPNFWRGHHIVTVSCPQGYRDWKLCHLSDWYGPCFLFFNVMGLYWALVFGALWVASVWWWISHTACISSCFCLPNNSRFCPLQNE